VDFKKLSRTRSGRRFSSFSRFRARQFCNTISFAEFYREFIKLIRGALTANARKLTHACAVCDMRFMKFVEAVDPLCIIALRRRATGGASVNAGRNFTFICGWRRSGFVSRQPVGPSKARSSVRDDPRLPSERHRRIRRTKPRVWGLADFASRNKNRVPQAEGDMTLLVWPGSKLECGFSKERNFSERVDGSIHSSTVKLMEPAPPG
jgi:hypothetical protein